MTKPIWQKNAPINIDKNMMSYMAGEDIKLDASLIQYDIQASKAHAQGLESIGILSPEELQSLLNCLSQLETEISTKQFEINAEYEDGHSAIEAYLTEHLGQLGKKIHTGRSRNDQVLVATRLYLKDSLNKAITSVIQSAHICLQQAEKSKNIAIPGYTHMQRAVPSSVGLWFASFSESMIDNIIGLKSALELIDSNPLGTAAGYGVNLDLNRQLTTELLGFSRLQINPMYCQNSRGKLELAVLSALSQCMLDVRRFCWDVSLFSTQEFDFVKLPETMTTGSSIMPNKRNPDLIELMRANYAIIQSSMTELQSLLSIPSGYQRDLQLTKEPLIRGINSSLKTLELFCNVCQHIEFKTDKCKSVIDEPMYATDYAVELSQQGVPFRDAYKRVVEDFDVLHHRTPEMSLKARISSGACANLMLNELKLRLQSYVTKQVT
ncbi:MAG: argininosuccinate lyase [Gammaproteobacteria bacterium]|nr:argininosuccinate lyase [Gammaproteobacteria bacterium]